MAIKASDVILLSQARANPSELANQVKADAEKVITKNGESYVALNRDDAQASRSKHHRSEDQT